MKDKTKKAFEEALDQFDAGQRAAKVERTKKQIGRENFEKDFERARTGVIIPALNSIAEMLRPRGWLCVLGGTPTKTTLDIYKGNMKAVAGVSRPHIAFEMDSTSPEVKVYAATQSQTDEEGKYKLSEITSDKVSELVLRVFRRLVSEGNRSP
jgi:hypothetical protein